MIHVPDVRAAAKWYQEIGFRILEAYDNDTDGWSFAILAVGDAQVMLNQGGQHSVALRREVDLYVYVDAVDPLYEAIKHSVDVVASPNNTEYGMREFIIRDLNGFWITFAQPRSDAPPRA